jgi:hypothetical protein
MTKNKKLNPYNWLNILKYVPNSVIREAICIAVVKQKVCALQYIPKSQMTEAVCIAAIEKYVGAFKFLSNSLKTETVCLAAVKHDGFLIQYVPIPQKTEAVCLAAIKHDSFLLQYIPNSLKTETVCFVAVKQNGYALKYVPGLLKTETMCLAALNKTAGALKYVPENLKTKLSPTFTIRLTDDEIEIINTYVNGLKGLEIYEIMHGNLIDKSDKFTPNIVWIEEYIYWGTQIENIIFSEGNTKAELKIFSRHTFDGFGYTHNFSKENGKWMEILEE